MIDYLKVYAQQLAPHLAPQERPVGSWRASYHSGREDLGQPPSAVDGWTVADVVLGLPSPALMDASEQLVSGTSLVGWPGCFALQIRDAARSGTRIVLTDLRLLIVRINSQGFVVTWDCPRAAVFRVQRASRTGQRGRVWLTCRDGSSVALVLSYFFARPANRLIAAWGEIPGVISEP